MTTYSFQQCVDVAEQIGFSASGADVICQTMGGESSYNSNVPCTCSSYENEDNPAAWIHGYQECIQAGLTPHCGLLQWANTWSIAQQPSCFGDLHCELAYAFSVSNQGTCFQPWVGDTSGNTNCTPNSGAIAGAGSGPGIENLATNCKPETGFCASDIGPVSVPFPWAGPCPFNARQATTCDFWGGSPSQNAPSVPNGSGGNCAPWDIGCVGKAIGTQLKGVGLLAVGLMFIFIGIIAVSHQGGTVVNLSKGALAA